MERVKILAEHLQPNEDSLSLAPVAAPQTDDDKLFHHKFERIPIKIWYQEEELFKERYGGSLGFIFLEGELLKPSTQSKTILIFMHPMGIQNLLPYPMALARTGVHVVTCASRYPNNDTTLIMEKVVLDLGACIRYCKEKLGYEKIVLAGWSGGGSLSAFYQSQAEHPTVTCTPAGEPPNLVKANLIPADAVLQIAAHVGRARCLVEWIDPAIIDEQDPTKRDPALDIYDPRNPNQPPYSPEFVKKYRAAQLARVRRITKWVKQKLQDLKQRNDGELEHCFVVYGTMADPKFLDMSLSPNDRKGPNWCFLGVPKTVNNGPVGLARFSSLRSWLSQWSIDDTNADGERHLGLISVPVLVIANSADDGPVDDAPILYNAVKHSNKEYHIIKGANHYYTNQKDKQAESCRILLNFLLKRKLLEEHLRPTA